MGKEDLQKVVELVADKTIFCTKEVLTSDEVQSIWALVKATYIS